MACWVLVSHGAYLRPVSNMKLRKRCLVPPVRGASNHWCLLLNASEFNLQSKTGTSDDSVVWDVRDLAFMARIFPLLARGNPDDKVWDFTYPELCRMVKLASEAIRIPFVPYQLRHSGPSWDSLQNLRPFLEVQKRGMWASYSSVARYEKAAHTLAEYRKVPESMRLYLDQVLANLERHVCDGLPVPTPPEAPARGPPRRPR